MIKINIYHQQITLNQLYNSLYGIHVFFPNYLNNFE